MLDKRVALFFYSAGKQPCGIRVYEIADIQTIKWDIPILTFVDVRKVCRVTGSMFWRSIRLARTPMAWTLALPKTNSFTMKIFYGLEFCRLLRSKEAKTCNC